MINGLKIINGMSKDIKKNHEEVIYFLDRVRRFSNIHPELSVDAILVSIVTGSINTNEPVTSNEVYIDTINAILI